MPPHQTNNFLSCDRLKLVRGVVTDTSPLRLKLVVLRADTTPVPSPFSPTDFSPATAAPQHTHACSLPGRHSPGLHLVQQVLSLLCSVHPRFTEGLYTPRSETGFSLQTNLVFSDSNYYIVVAQIAKIRVFFPAILPQMLGTSWYSVKKKLIGLEKEREERKEEILALPQIPPLVMIEGVYQSVFALVLCHLNYCT